LATVSADLPRATPLGPVNGAFGAEISGVDLAKPLAPPVIKELINLQNKYGVLAFRSTGLDDETREIFEELCNF
jgi:alpha-ketoglutarate-dependent 2,4-dichlorophenoxyacetate dioxygenase